jgi:DNA-binding NarL/FixJ family response regulator
MGRTAHSRRPTPHAHIARCPGAGSPLRCALVQHPHSPPRPRPSAPAPAAPPPPGAPLRVLLADAHPTVREGLRTLLADEPDLRLIGEAESGAVAVTLAGALRPDVILLDVALPAAGAGSTIRRLRAVAPSSRILVLTGLAGGREVRAAIAAGATGYLLKDVLWADLRQAIRQAARGVPVLHPAARRHLQPPSRSPSSPPGPLSPTERDVLGHLARGRADDEIAAALGRPPHTVRRRVHRLLGKLGAADRLQAALIGLDQQLATLQ